MKSLIALICVLFSVSAFAQIETVTIEKPNRLQIEMAEGEGFSEEELVQFNLGEKVFFVPKGKAQKIKDQQIITKEILGYTIPSTKSDWKLYPVGMILLLILAIVAGIFFGRKTKTGEKQENDMPFMGIHIIATIICILFILVSLLKPSLYFTTLIVTGMLIISLAVFYITMLGIIRYRFGPNVWKLPKYIPGS